MGRNGPNIKRSIGVFVIVLRLLHFQASTIISEQLCQFFKDCFPLFCDLNFSPKNSHIHFRKISALLPFTLNATEIMTFFEHNRSIIFKKRSIHLVKARCRESNTSRQSSSHFLLQLCFLLKKVRVHLPRNIFLYIFQYTKIKIDSNVALHMHLTLTLSSAHVKKNTIKHFFSSVSCFLFSSNSPKIEQIK